MCCMQLNDVSSLFGSLNGRRRLPRLPSESTDSDLEHKIQPGTNSAEVSPDVLAQKHADP
jgi:hypothetical protein